MSHLSAREWGRLQASKAPPWGEERWKRVSIILGLELIETKEQPKKRTTNRTCG
ncbi:hypothetical protein AB0K71_13770 [Streptomyces syringium]|uniref:hypothetical protein n=1 Tax=Streptomyces syringium TaxID=76729 RepID=UPI003440AFAE